MNDSALVPVDPHGVMQLPMWSPTALALPDDLTFAAWESIGAVIGAFDRSVQWWMGDWWKFGETKYGERASQALDSDWSFQTWANAGWVASRFEGSRRREVLSWGHHAEVAADPADVADAWLDEAEAEGWSVHELRKQRRTRHEVTPVAALPSGKYSVILADPPWRYEFAETDNRAVENQYPTLTADEIACFEDADGRPVADLAADDAVLYLWATSPKLREALAVIQGWGFEYVTSLVWVKDRIGMGYWARERHELLLVARRGDIRVPPPELRPDSVIEAPRGRHSEKPEAVHLFIEAIWPDEPKVEVFARLARPGWSAVGNQLAAAA